MLPAVVFCAVLFWIGVFVVCFTAQGTTVAEFFLGRYEALPSDLGQWRVVEDPPRSAPGDPRAGWVREERLLLPEGTSNARHLVHQVRYRDPSTQAIVRVEPEELVPRRRVSARAS